MQIDRRKFLVGAAALGGVTAVGGLLAPPASADPDGPTSWTASEGFSSTQGLDQWYYLRRPAAGGAFAQLDTFDIAWRYGTNDSPWLYIATCHPGPADDVIRAWVAPTAGTIAITGRVYKTDTGGGGGIVATVQHNSTVLWTRTVAGTDGTGYTTDAALTAVPVGVGDTIYFIVNNNGDYFYDEVGWDPTITYVSTGSTPTWTLATADTQAVIAVTSNRPTLQSLTNRTSGWNWIAAPQQLPVPTTVYIGGVAHTVNWTYQNATVTSTSVALHFSCTSPNLALTSTWTAGAGSGPIEHAVTVQNNTGGAITYQYSDVASTDLTLTANAPLTLWRFNRSSVNQSPDTGFTTGVFKTVLTTNQTIDSTVSNDINPGLFVLPFEMLDAGAVHGLYLGYVWSFGQFHNATQASTSQVQARFGLGSSGSVVSAAGAVLAVPSMFYGTYSGDTDAGSNLMKRWFYQNKMTPTLRLNTNEPLVEYGLDLYTASDCATFLSANPLATWGVDLIKEDAWWTDDVNTWPFGYDWTPDATKWPGGMTLGTTAHSHSLKLSLYMANTYQHADLATPAGRAAEKAAALTRFDNWGYDYWRTDGYFEAIGDYLSHEGFLEVMDYMIASRPGFRWENCSFGGSKKSFDFLQRMTFMTVEDSGISDAAVINYRMAYYANSYMINSVQLKSDNTLPVPFPNSTVANYVFRTGMLGAWMFGSVGSTTFSVSDYTAAITLYKTKQRPILRGADVFHILPMPDNVNWDGFEFFNPTLNKGSVFLFHPSASAASSKTIVLKGLSPTANYTLTFQDRTAQNTTKTGAALMSTGITVTGMTGDNASEIIWIN